MGEDATKKKTTSDPRAPGRKVDEHLSSPEDTCVDQASEDSFPASDPPSYTPVTHSGKPKKGPVAHKDRGNG